TRMPWKSERSESVTGPIPARPWIGASARLNPEPGMPSPAGFTLIAPKARAVAVVLSESARLDALACASCAPAPVLPSASARVVQASAASVRIVLSDLMVVSSTDLKREIERRLERQDLAGRDGDGGAVGDAP